MWRLSKCEKVLAILFFFTLPLLRPWVHGDGRGYYAFARALLLQHNLDFQLDWYKGYSANPQVSDPNFRQNYLTSNGHINNHWTVGPAILWSPFLICARLTAGIMDKFAHAGLASDGYSKPYMFAMSLGTFTYGFLALLFSMRIARRYFEERWVLLATVAVWLATSFAFYLYAEPSFAHIPSAFLVSLFILIWDHTRQESTWTQWLALGLIAGLMLDTYYPNALVLLLPFFDLARGTWSAFREPSSNHWRTLIKNNLLFGGATLFAFMPTLLTKKILYDSYFHSGYKQFWFWNSPAFFRVCFSSHGVFSWTPVLILAVIGLYCVRIVDRTFGNMLLAVVASFVYFIGCYQDWHAIPSFGNRFFVSLTPIFIIGLTAFLSRLSTLFATHRIWLPASASIFLLVVWNFGLMFQFATHLFPQDTDVSWKSVAYNQVVVVPSRAAGLFKEVITRRAGLRPVETNSGSGCAAPNALVRR